MTQEDINKYDTKIKKGCVTQLYTLGKGYVEIRTSEVEAEELYPAFYLGHGVHVESNMEAEFLFETGELTSDGGTRNNMLVCVQERCNNITVDHFQWDWEFQNWCKAYDEYVWIVDTYMVG